MKYKYYFCITYVHIITIQNTVEHFVEWEEVCQ